MDAFKHMAWRLNLWFRWLQPLESAPVFAGGVQIDHCGCGARRKSFLAKGKCVKHRRQGSRMARS